jgi:hypothetical protein
VFFVKQSADSTPAAGIVSFPLTSCSSVQHLVNAAVVPVPYLESLFKSPEFEELFGKGKETVYGPLDLEIKAAQLALKKVLPPLEVRGTTLVQQQPHQLEFHYKAANLQLSGRCQLANGISLSPRLINGVLSMLYTFLLCFGPGCCASPVADAIAVLCLAVAAAGVG